MSLPFRAPRIVVLPVVAPGPIRIEIRRDERTMDEVGAANYARRELRKGCVYEDQANADLVVGCKALELTLEAVYVRTAGMAFWQDAGESGTGYAGPTVGSLVYKTAAVRHESEFFEGSQNEPFVEERTAAFDGEALAFEAMDRARRELRRAGEVFEDELDGLLQQGMALLVTQGEARKASVRGTTVFLPRDVVTEAKAKIRSAVDQGERNAVKARAWEEASAMATIEADGPDDPEALIFFQGRSFPGQEYPGMMAALMDRDAALRSEGFDPFGSQA